MSTILYLRVSTSEQSTDNQLNALTEAGYVADKVFQDIAVSGTSEALTRPQWKLCFEYLRSGDTLAVFAIDRLGRSTVDCLNTINALELKGVRVVFLQQGFDTATPAGKLALTMFSAFAQFETELRKERQMLGIRRVQASGGYKGRPKSLTQDQIVRGKYMLASGSNKAQVARELGVSRNTIYRSI
jgi:putative DNA-invertase from lambdoid prophage Rac